MSQELVPSSTLAPFIVRKLDALGSDPSNADLDALNKLLDTVPPERVVSDEEVQELKNLEKKTLGNQDEYKKETENVNKRTMFTIFVGVLFPLPVFLCALMTVIHPIFNVVGKNILMMTCWPVKLVAVVFLFHFCGFDHGFKFGTPEPEQPEVLENEEDDDDDWQYSMTSTELHSRQKAIVNSWEQLKTDRKGDLVSQILFDIAFVLNVAYNFIIVAAIYQICEEESNLFSSLTFVADRQVMFFFIEFNFSIAMALLFCVPFWVNVLQVITFQKNFVSKLQYGFEQVVKNAFHEENFLFPPHELSRKPLF